jgi:beta-alanine degradation protein BauB
MGVFFSHPKGGVSMATPATPQPLQNDPTQVDSQHYKIELETEKIRVLRARYGAREKSEMHAHPDLIVILLTDGHIQMTYPDGRTEEITAKAGEVLNMPATVHCPENLAEEGFEAILIEIKN